VSMETNDHTNSLDPQQSTTGRADQDDSSSASNRDPATILANPPADREKESVRQLARQARRAAATLAGANVEQRNLALKYAAQELRERQAEILEVNAREFDAACKLLSQGSLSQALIDRLKLDANKVQSIIAGLEQVEALPDPLGAITLATELDKGLELYRVTCPIGLILVIFESRPDALPQISSLCLKSGNAVILKGGKEAKETNRILFDCMQRAAVRAGLPQDCLGWLETRGEISGLLDLEGYVDLVIPRGSAELVRRIQITTNIPVLGHADGLCHLYVHEDADLDLALKLAVDSKTQYPAACNSIETLLIHKRSAPVFAPKVIDALRKMNVELRCDEASLSMAPKEGHFSPKSAHDADWDTEYCDLILSIKVIDSLDDAIRHINEHGSHHTDAIVTTSEAAFQRFFTEVNSAGVFCNASTRFADGFRYGFGAEVGISTGKLHPRGPVGLEGLVTYKYKVVGKGHIVADYVGDNAKLFSHKQIEP
jgi:glutamate-5-semialdehyde dehydrogenase